MLRPEGATAFNRQSCSERSPWVDFMHTATRIVVCQNFPMDVRKAILTTDFVEGTVRRGTSNLE